MSDKFLLYVVIATFLVVSFFKLKHDAGMPDTIAIDSMLIKLYDLDTLYTGDTTDIYYKLKEVW